MLERFGFAYKTLYQTALSQTKAHIAKLSSANKERTEQL